MLQFVKLTTISDFGSARIRSFQILGRHVGIVRDPDGSFFATEISCKHQNADLSNGTLRGDVVTCPRHFWKYDLRTGECITHASARLRRHSLRVEGDDILVSLHPEPESDDNEDLDFPAPVIRRKDND